MYMVKERVGASHTDSEGNLKVVSALDMMQNCSQLWLESEPALEKFFKESNIAQMLVSRQTDILRIPVYGERLTVETRAYDCKKLLGYRNTVIYDGQGSPCIVSWSIGAFVNLETGRPEKLPDEILAGLCIDPKFDMEYLGKKIALPVGPGQRFDPVKVSRNDIDFNRHMNNARYVQIAVEFLPADFTVSRFRIEYKMPAKHGDSLYPVIFEESGAFYLVLSDGGENGRVFTVMEFRGA
jgi:acyl-ACP thioesterase